MCRRVHICESRGAGIQAAVQGVTLTGDFSFEQVSRVGGGQLLRIGAQHVNLNIGAGATPVASLTNGSASLLVMQGGTADQSGVAGTISGTIGLNVPEFL